MHRDHCRRCRVETANAKSAEFAPQHSVSQYPPDRGLQPVALAVHIQIDIDAKILRVEQTWTVRAQRTGLKSLVLDGVALQEVSAQLGPNGRFCYDGQAVSLLWDKPFEAGEERQAEVQYMVVAPAGGVLFSPGSTEAHESSNPSHRPDEALVSSGPTARFAVTDHETERARHWLACVDHPSVRPVLDIFLRAEAPLTHLANGTLVSEQLHEDGTKTTHYRQAQGCPSYLTCFAVGNFVRWEDGNCTSNGRTLEVAAFALPPFEEAHIERTVRNTKRMLQFLEERLQTPFPFDKYYQFFAPGIGGAMENISLVSWDERFLLDERLETEERQLADVVNVHEMAHSWFGDSVVCRDHSHSWLKEGWATYIESCWLEHSSGQPAFAYDLWQCQQAYFSERDDCYQRPIVTRRYDSSFDLFDRHLYPGAGLRIDMLRKMLGEACFWPAVGDYLQQYAGKLSETDDFRRVLEEHSGLSLAEFFDQWFYRAAIPELTITFEHDAEAAQGRFEIVQDQADEKSDQGLCRVELELAFGNETLAPSQTVALRARRTVAVFPMLQPPDRIAVDPEGKLLHRLKFNPGVARLERQLGAENLSGRLQAATLLVDRGPSGAAAMQRAYSQQEHWQVRCALLWCLGKSQCETARVALMQLGKQEMDPRCAPTLYQALGKYRHPDLVPFLREQLDLDLGYRATESALEALGAQRLQAPLSLLTNAARTQGFGGFTQSGALRALAESRHPEALSELCHALSASETPREVRPAVAKSLGSLLQVLEKRPAEVATEALVAALQHPDPNLSLAAAEALGVAGCSAALPPLRAYAARLPHQQAAVVRRIMAKLRTGSPLSEQRGLVESLEQRLIALQAQVEELKASKDAP